MQRARLSPTSPGRGPLSPCQASRAPWCTRVGRKLALKLLLGDGGRTWRPRCTDVSLMNIRVCPGASQPSASEGNSWLPSMPLGQALSRGWLPKVTSVLCDSAAGVAAPSSVGRALPHHPAAEALCPRHSCVCRHPWGGEWHLSSTPRVRGDRSCRAYCVPLSELRHRSITHG